MKACACSALQLETLEEIRAGLGIRTASEEPYSEDKEADRQYHNIHRVVRPRTLPGFEFGR